MYDFYAYLAGQQACPTDGPPPDALASGFIDGCTYWFAYNQIESARIDDELNRESDAKMRKVLQRQKKTFEDAKNHARSCYRERASAGELKLPPDLDLDAPIAPPLQLGCLAVEVRFKLVRPWYSKDDRPFHVLDNPVRKDGVFGVPYMAAASWKGLLRWSFRMTTGLIGPAPLKDEKKRREAEAAIVHLFGNEKGATDDFQRGSLAFYPTWFSRIGFEVINPHSRKTRAGTKPIYYEVVPPGTAGCLKLLYAPLPGQAAKDGVTPGDALGKLLDATEKLLTVYGFSAKRTAGWGLATVNELVIRNTKRSQKGDLATVKAGLPALLGAKEATP